MEQLGQTNVFQPELHCNVMINENKSEEVGRDCREGTEVESG